MEIGVRAGRRCLFSWPSPVLWLHTDKLALKAAGGKTGFPMTISTMQLGVGVLYALSWAPEADGTAQLATANSHSQVMIWDAVAGVLQRKISLLPQGKEEPLFGVHWSPHAEHAAA